jgi:hypothetical protein
MRNEAEQIQGEANQLFHASGQESEGLLIVEPMTGQRKSELAYVFHHLKQAVEADPSNTSLHDEIAANLAKYTFTADRECVAEFTALLAASKAASSKTSEIKKGSAPADE